MQGQTQGAGVHVVGGLGQVDVGIGVEDIVAALFIAQDISRARLAITSLAFMLVEVPPPPWITSTTNSCM